MTKKRTPTLPIRLGLIGCGGIVKIAHVPSFQALPDVVQVVAVADPVPENRAEVGDALGVPPSQRYTTHSELLDRADVDAVSIATPHHLHAAHVIAAAEAGVAIISEKPMAASMEQALAIRAAVIRARVPYTIVHNIVHSVPMQEALARLRSGALGQPFFGRGVSLFNKGPRETQTAASWRNTRATGGGSVADTCYHEIYSVEALMGAPIRYVEARVKTMYYDIDVDDMALLLLEHDNGALSTVSTAWCVPTPAAEGGRWCEVHAPGGSLRVHHRAQGPFLSFTNAGGWQEVALPGLADPRATASARLVGHAGYFEAVCRALASDATLGATPLPTTVDTACHMMAVVEGARLASERRQAVAVDELWK